MSIPSPVDIAVDISEGRMMLEGLSEPCDDIMAITVAGSN